MTKSEFIEKHGCHNWAAHYEIESDIDTLLKKTVQDAIYEYLMDKSDKVHINTLEDWVNDWYDNL